MAGGFEAADGGIDDGYAGLAESPVFAYRSGIGCFGQAAVVGELVAVVAENEFVQPLEMSVCQAFGGQQARGNAACGQVGIEEAGVFSCRKVLGNRVVNQILFECVPLR